MNHALPERADFQHLRAEAKALHRALNDLEPSAVALATAHDLTLDPAGAKLADAQRLVARKYGFSSWNQLKSEVETPQLMARFVDLVQRRDAAKLDELLGENAVVRDRINDPVCAFDAPALVVCGDLEVARVLLRHGADPNARSRWWAGGFGALDLASDAMAELLLQHGATFDVWSAAVHGKFDVLRETLDGNPDLVNARGGDGRTPLHFASSVEVAELLLDHGADPNLRDVDHESTPLQYQLHRTEVVRLLLDRGAEPDPFAFVQLDDAVGLANYLERHPEAVQWQVGKPPYVTKTSNGGHIYTWEVGTGKTLLMYAAEHDRRQTLKLLSDRASGPERLLAACLAGSEADVRRVLAEIGPVEIPPEMSRALAHVAGAGRTETVRLMLLAGFDPMVGGQDQGTALHQAAWYGRQSVAELLVDRVPLETRDGVHGSTVLGWAVHGAQWCNTAGADYPGLVEYLLQQGADVHATANRNGVSMMQQAGNRQDVRAVLHRYGAK